MDDQTTLDSPDETEALGGELPLDTNSDGQTDTLVGDANEDGVTDYVTVTTPEGTVTLFDNDQSGLFEEARIDTDGDWVADATAFDTTGDGVFDVVQTVDPATGQLVTTPLDGGSNTPIQTDPVPATEPVPQPQQPQQPVVDLVHGDGDQEVIYAQDQEEPGYCGPASIAIILTELVGYPIDDAAVALDVYNQNRLVYREDGSLIGMTSASVVYMFDLYGVESHVENGDMDDLRTYLDEDRNIILAVDSSEVWGWKEDGLDVSDYPGSGTSDRSDHFLVITEINDETGMVTLNDPGLGEAYGFGAGTGHGYQIPIELLEDAWADSGHEMIVTDPIPTTAGGPALDAAAGAASADAGSLAVHPGLVMLPAEVGRRLVIKLREQGRGLDA